MRREIKLDITESSDFQYLLELMLPLYRIPEFAWLPELFSIIGYEKLIMLCKVCGGEQIQIPKIEELSDSIEALEWYFKVHLIQSEPSKKIPFKYRELVKRIKETLDARDN